MIERVRAFFREIRASYDEGARQGEELMLDRDHDVRAKHRAIARRLWSTAPPLLLAMVAFLIVLGVRFGWAASMVGAILVGLTVAVIAVWASCTIEFNALRTATTMMPRPITTPPPVRFAEWDRPANVAVPAALVYPVLEIGGTVDQADPVHRLNALCCVKYTRNEGGYEAGLSSSAVRICVPEAWFFIDDAQRQGIIETLDRSAEALVERAKEAL